MSNSLPDWKERRIIKMLKETDLLQSEIAKLMGTSNSVIHHIKKKLGIERDTNITLIGKLKGKGLIR